MKTHSASASPANRHSIGYFALMATILTPCLNVVGQSTLPKGGPDFSRLPKIKVESPLLAVPTKGDEAAKKEKEEAAKVQVPKPVEKAPAAAPADKPKMKEPADAAAPPVAAPAAPAAGAANGNKASGTNPLLPPKNMQPMTMQPDPSALNLKKLIDEANAAPAAAAISISKSTVIIQSLAGITLFRDDRKNPTDTPSSIPSALTPGVNIGSDLTTPQREELIALLQQKFIGKPVTFEGLDVIVKEILSFYSDKKRPMTHVYIPEQEIADKIKIAVLEGRLGDVRFAGEAEKRRWYQAPAPRIPGPLEAQKGQVLDMNSITKAVTELNLSPWSRLGRQDAHPYRSASVSLTPGTELGLTDVDLAVKSKTKLPIQTFMGWDNTGTVVLGENRFNFGTVWYDAFNTGYNHQLGIQFQSAENYDLFHAVIASYQIPIPSLKSTFQIYGAFMQSAVSIPAAGVQQSIEGDAWILGGRYYYQLPSWYITEAAKKADDKTRQVALYHEIGFGFDYKSQANNLFFGGINVFPTQIEVAQFAFEYNLRQTDKLGETTAGLAYFYSPGQLTRNNTDSDFATARTGGTADYSYFRGNFARVVELGALTRHLNDFKFMVRATGQWSTANLVASEQLGLGGNDSVRGYPERTMRGDRGLFIQAELYSPAFHPLKFLAQKTPDRWMTMDERTDDLRFLVFYDYGWGDVFNPTAAEPGEVLNLSSIGIGLRYRYNKSMTFRFDYGYQLEKLDPTRVNAFDLSPRYSNSGDGYAHMGLSLSF